MSLMNKKPNIIEEIIKVSQDAGKAILDIYNKSDSDFELKEDKSPLTKADISSHNIIINSLKYLTPSIPIISEEDCGIPLKERLDWKEYWLIDPLDGTKEFIKRNGEFTVNIALIRKNEPVLGVINIPAMEKIFWADGNNGSHSINADGKSIRMNVKKDMEGSIKIAASRSHYNNKLDSILAELEDYELINVGSSIKFCLVASGEADIYIRFGPTSEWDTAAGEAIVKFAGGRVISTIGKQISYNKKESFLNPDFIVSKNNHLLEKILKKIELLDFK